MSLYSPPGLVDLATVTMSQVKARGDRQHSTMKLGHRMVFRLCMREGTHGSVKMNVKCRSKILNIDAV